MCHSFTRAVPMTPAQRADIGARLDELAAEVAELTRRAERVIDDLDERICKLQSWTGLPAYEQRGIDDDVEFEARFQYYSLTLDDRTALDGAFVAMSDSRPARKAAR